MIELRLPFPPSANNLFFNVDGEGRKIAKAYRQWRKDAGWELAAQHPERITERVVIRIDLDDSRQGDAANREKAVVDLLVTHGVLAGDSKKYVQRVSTGWERVTGCRVVIQPCGDNAA